MVGILLNQSGLCARSVHLFLEWLHSGQNDCDGQVLICWEDINHTYDILTFDALETIARK